MIPNLILCLGNEILSDDSFGFRIAEVFNDKYDFNEKAEVIFSPLGGFNLVDLLKDRKHVLIIDTIITGRATPGTLHFMEMGQFTPARNLTCSHQISLPTAIAFGRKYGYSMPDNIDVLAVEAEDVTTLSDKMTSPVEAALYPAIDRIVDWIKHKNIDIMDKSNICRNTKPPYKELPAC